MTYAADDKWRSVTPTVTYDATGLHQHRQYQCSLSQGLPPSAFSRELSWKMQVSVQHATLVPSSPLDPIQDLILSPAEIPAAIRLALGSSEAAPLFSAELARDAKVYWVEQLEAQVPPPWSHFCTTLHFSESVSGGDDGVTCPHCAYIRMWSCSVGTASPPSKHALHGYPHHFALEPCPSLTSQTNERIQRSTGLSTIRGDALVLYSPATAATSDAANADSASASAPSADSASPTFHFSRHWFESPAPHPHGPRSARTSAEGQGVDILPVTILQDIFGRLTFSHLSACAAVCSLWRVAVSQDEVSSNPNPSDSIRREWFNISFNPAFPSFQTGSIFLISNSFS